MDLQPWGALANSVMLLHCDFLRSRSIAAMRSIWIKPIFNETFHWDEAKKKLCGRKKPKHWQLIYVQCTLLFSFYFLPGRLVSSAMLSQSQSRSASSATAGEPGETERSREKSERKRHQKEIICYGFRSSSSSCSRNIVCNVRWSVWLDVNGSWVARKSMFEATERQPILPSKTTVQMLIVGLNCRQMNYNNQKKNEINFLNDQRRHRHRNTDRGKIKGFIP